MTGEITRKIERVVALARVKRLAGIVLATRHNFAWLTAGIDSTVDGSRETSAGALLVTAAGRPFILGNNIEAPRLADIVQPALGADIIEFPWTGERADPSLPLVTAAAAAGGSVGADIASPHAMLVEADLARVRVTLDEAEIPRFSALALDTALAVEETLRAVRPGTREVDVRAAIATALLPQGIQAPVLLVGADERIDRFRHPIATTLAWRDRLLVAVCGTRQGQFVALSRIITTAADAEFRRRTHAAAAVFGALLDATVPSATGRDLFAAATRAYAAQGLAGEEQRHHQGGAIAYRSREWVAHPGSEETVGVNQAFAWNPSVTGTKVEDTCLLDGSGRLAAVTSTGRWPIIELSVRGGAIRAADTLVIG